MRIWELNETDIISCNLRVTSVDTFWKRLQRFVTGNGYDMR